MANRYRNLIYSNAEYTRSYNGFSGVELNASSITSSPKRLSFAQNMYRDYDGDGAEVIESVPGYRCFAHYGKKVHAIYYQRSQSDDEDHIIVHVGNKLMRHPVSDIDGESTEGEELTTLLDSDSFGFEFGRYFYVMDSQKIFRIEDDGTCQNVGTAGAYPYVPTTYISGIPYEQRNLLVRDFREEYYISDPGEYSHATSGVKYAVSDPYQRYCSVTGIDYDVSGDVYIPSSVDICGITYKVMSIDNYAFADNDKIVTVIMADGPERVGSHAFSNCTSLELVAVAPSVTDIGAYAFSGCEMLSTLSIGGGIQVIEEHAFDGCDELYGIDYALGEDDIKNVTGGEQMIEKDVCYRSEYNEIMVSLPLHDKTEAISSVTVNGEERFWEYTEEDGCFKNIIIRFTNASEAAGAKIIISGSLLPLDDDWSSDMTVLSPSTPQQAIVRCTVAEVFDGRIFFSGNPSYPNTVFYTERADKTHDGALYVGRYNYFNDGVGSNKVRAMLAVRDMLAVFKESDDGSGSIFYHKKEAVDLGAVDTIYPVAYVHSGICASGPALSFFDDPVFITKDGIMALERENINYQRNIACRSHNVNYALLKEDLARVNLCEWLGYLVVGVNGKVFLADSRAMFKHSTGNYEYEWFTLDEIGGYTGDKRVYRYSANAYLDTVPHPYLVGYVAANSQVYSKVDSSGNIYYYVPKGSTKYSIEATDERNSGTFWPATVFTSYEKLLFFGTNDGHLCVFNNDKRGIAPYSITNSDDYDEDEYKINMAGRLHPLHYSFAGHTPTYIIKTSLDDCGVPHLTKNTVKKSLVIKAKSYRPDIISCEVQSDTRDPVYIGCLPTASESFDDFDFMVMPWYASRYASVTLYENEKRWIEKQITMVSQTFASPIFIYSINYRYTIRGRIKNDAE